MSIIPNLSEKFDDLKVKAFTLASKYTLLFTHYWQDKSKMDAYFSELNGNFAFDPNNFFLIRKSTTQIKFPEIKNRTIPVLIYFGKNDFISKLDNEKYYIKKFFKNTKFHIIENTLHYSYLEKPENIFKE